MERGCRMLLKRYAKCLDGRQEQNNPRIEAASTRESRSTTGPQPASANENGRDSVRLETRPIIRCSPWSAA